MKYLMGLLVSFAFMVGGYAQERHNDMYERTNSSAKYREHKSDMSEVSREGSFAKRENVNEHLSVQRLQNGSVYYSENPMDMTSSMPKDHRVSKTAKVKTKTNQAAVNKRPAATTSGFSFGKQCALNNLLDSKEGAFKVKYDAMGGELKLQREKNGEAKIKFEGDNEYYKYKENKEGQSKYTYTALKGGNEVIEIIKNEDGSGQIFYQGEFQNLDDATVLEEGFNFEGVESVCN